MSDSALRRVAAWTSAHIVALRIVEFSLAAFFGWMTTVHPRDLVQFGRSGGAILSLHLDSVYNAAWTQAGPLQLLANRLLLTVSPQGQPTRLAVAAMNVVIVGIVLGTCRWRSRGQPLARVEILRFRECAVAAFVLLWLYPTVFWSGHPAEVAVPLLWMAAVAAFRRDEVWLGAAALGLSAGFTPWGVLAFPAVLVIERPSRIARTAVVTSMTTAALYLPFLATGHFRMFGYHSWFVWPRTFEHLVDPRLTWIGWQLRVIQALVVGLGVAYAARRYRDHVLVCALVPLTAAILRVATDPTQLDYYWLPVGVCAIGCLVIASADVVQATWLGLVALNYVAWCASTAITGWTIPACLAAGVAMVAVASRLEPSRGASPSVPPELVASPQR